MTISPRWDVVGRIRPPVAIAAALQCRPHARFITDVDGVYTTDPRIVKEAKKLSEITYDEMLELASMGAQVLCNRSVEMAKKYNVELEVLSSLEALPGTIVKEVVTMEKMLVRGVARDNDIARISLVGVHDTPGIAYRVFSKLAARKINVDIILQSVGRDGTKDISFTVPRAQSDDAVEALGESAESLGASKVLCDTNVSKVSIVGAGMESHPGVAATMFEALSTANINIQMISTSEIKISVLIDQADSERAVQAVHRAFFER